MMGIVLPETCWACNKICNTYNLLHLVGILFPHNNDDARSKSLQMYFYITILTVNITANITPADIRKNSFIGLPKWVLRFQLAFKFPFQNPSRAYPASVSFPVPSASYKADLPQAQSCHFLSHLLFFKTTQPAFLHKNTFLPMSTFWY